VGIGTGVADDGFTAFFQGAYPRIVGQLRLLTGDLASAEDIAQEAFVAAVRALHTFDRRRPFGPWLHRIVVNRAIDWARARALRREVGDDDAFAAVPAPESGNRGRPLSENVVAGLAALSPEHRAVIVLRYLFEYTPGEIAALLELPRGTVNSRLRRGLDALAERISAEDV